MELKKVLPAYYEFVGEGREGGSKGDAVPILYSKEKYHLIEVTKTGRKYVEQRKRFKESLVSKHKTELLGDLMPMDFHIYEINLRDGRLEMEIDYHWNVFGISYSGSKKTIKRMKGIAKDLYLYYGVSEEDIQKKSERYHSLLATLST